MTKPDIRILPAVQPARMQQEAPILGETEAQRVARIKAALDRIETRPGTTVHETLESMALEADEERRYQQAIDDAVFDSEHPALLAPAPLSIAIQRLNPRAIIPTQGKVGDAGYDLYAEQHATVYAGTRSMIDTGVAVAIPEGYVGYIKPRSGLAWKQGIQVLGGVIDAGYRGEVRVILHNTDANRNFNVDPGDRIAQLVVQPVASLDFREVEELPSSERGQGGFGSTGV